MILACQSAHGRTTVAIRDGNALVTVQGTEARPPLDARGELHFLAVTNDGRCVALVEGMNYWLSIHIWSDGQWKRGLLRRMPNGTRQVSWDEDAQPPELVCQTDTGAVCFYEWRDGWKAARRGA